MLRLNALGSRRLLESVKEDARRPTDASATSTRGMAIFLLACQFQKMTSRAKPSLPPAAVVMVAAA